jgi:hypothetical protein
MSEVDTRKLYWVLRCIPPNIAGTSWVSRFEANSFKIIGVRFTFRVHERLRFETLDSARHAQAQAQLVQPTKIVKVTSISRRH